MAIEMQEREIVGCPVRCTPFKARAAARLLSRLLKHAGAVLGQLGGVDLTDLKGVEVAALAPALMALANTLTPDEFDSLTCALLAQTSVTAADASGTRKNFDLSKPDNIDNAFAGDLKLMFRVLAFSVEVNYGSFFDGLGQRGESLAASPEADPSS